MSVQVPVADCQKKLGALWFSVAALLFLFLVVQSIVGVYQYRTQTGLEDLTSDAWGWFLPTLMPTLSLIVAAFVTDLKSRRSTVPTVDRFFFRMAFWLSALYLAVVVMSLLGTTLFSQSPLSDLKTSNLWLGPLQGLTSAAIGAFFVKRRN
jgi:hypothetical protein